MERRRGAFTGDTSPRGKSGNSGVCVAPRTWIPDQVRNDVLHPRGSPARVGCPSDGVEARHFRTKPMGLRA